MSKKSHKQYRFAGQIGGMTLFFLEKNEYRLQKRADTNKL